MWVISLSVYLPQSVWNLNCQIDTALRDIADQAAFLKQSSSNHHEEWTHHLSS